ncbi:MAG: DUF1732 domain-containing protein [Planctomycetes bacterium]|nr:DUF1732 domain-containing protein [Planctomycetota bacterium]
MTGAGFASADTEVGPLRVEVRAVNGRGLAVKLRLAAPCQGFEAAIEELVREAVARGTVTVVAEREGADAGGVDRAQFAAAAAALWQLATDAGLRQPTAGEVLQFLAAAGRGDPVTSRPLPPRVRAVFAAALADLRRHRADDGAGTVQAMREQLSEFARLRATAAERAPQLAAVWRERLLQRVQELIAQHVPGPPPAIDLVREVALYADRVDTAEELQRLEHHLAEIDAVLARGGEVGRRLEFLLQELLRETNTLGSKSPDSSVAHTVVAMKSGIDRLREQAANLE